MNHKELRALCKSLGDQSDMCGKLAGETEALLDKLKATREALEPFAGLHQLFSQFAADTPLFIHYTTDDCQDCVVGDLRRAKEVYEDKD